MRSLSFYFINTLRPYTLIHQCCIDPDELLFLNFRETPPWRNTATPPCGMSSWSSLKCSHLFANASRSNCAPTIPSSRPSSEHTSSTWRWYRTMERRVSLCSGIPRLCPAVIGLFTFSVCRFPAHVRAVLRLSLRIDEGLQSHRRALVPQLRFGRGCLLQGDTADRHTHRDHRLYRIGTFGRGTGSNVAH